MKGIGILTLGLLAGTLHAQTIINKSIPLQKGQKVDVRFDYPELIKVSTWDKNEVSIHCSVSINDGENDNAFKLETGSTGNTITVRNEIKDIEDLPHRITVMEGGQKLVFRSKAEWKKYAEEHGNGNSNMSYNLEMDIEIEIKVPKNTETYIESTYGMVEIKNFTGPLQVQATYGGVDAALSESTTGELIAETNYGRIYSNLDTKFNADNVEDEDFHTYVAVKPGSGPRYKFESQYGKVYLRKAQ